MTLNDAFQEFCHKVGYQEPDVLEKAFANRFFPAETSLEIADPTVIQYINQTLVPHKVAVFEAGIKIVGACVGSISRETLYQYAVHDLSKFSPEELNTYAHYFSDKEKAAAMKKVFPAAWHHHKTHNEHHPEHWLSVDRRGKVTPLPMPERFVMEMVADWEGASIVYGGGMETWMEDNLPLILFHPQTRETLNKVLEKCGYQVRC
ncbi:MAG: DUF5662 family protein [Bacteroidia bacterium]